MRKDLLLASIILAFVMGLVVGLFTGAASVSTQEPQSPSIDHIQYIQALSENGFRVENKSMEDSFWITPKSFTLFLELARLYDIRDIFYSIDAHGKVYFWYVYNPTSTIRWDVP